MERARIHHLVVLGRGRKVAGVLSARDLRAAGPGTTVGDLMSSPAVTISSAEDVQTAARLLRRHGVGCLPVLERGRVVGVLATSDLLALLGKGTLRVQPRTTRWTMPKRGPTHRPEPRRA
jgi:magnesium transporter